MSEMLVKKYAKVLFDSAKEKGVIDDVYNNATALNSVLSQAPEFLRALSNPSFSVAQKTDIISATLKDKVNEVFHTFLVFLVRKNRITFLSDICRKYFDLYYEEKKFLEAEITTSIKADKELCDTIVQHLSHKFQKTIVPVFKVAPQIIGGIKIRVGDNVVDYTIQGQLERFSKNIIFA